jgi:hypothetical protein
MLPASSVLLDGTEGSFIKLSTSLPGSPPIGSGGKAPILEILNVCLWLKFSPSLTLNKTEHFSKVSYRGICKRPFLSGICSLGKFVGRVPLCYHLPQNCPFVPERQATR